MLTLSRCLLVSVVVSLCACAAPREEAEDTWARRASDMVSPLVPEMLKPGSRGPGLAAAARLEPADFALADRREVRVIFTVQNTTKRAERLEFANTQRMELTVRGPDGKQIFLWSEDRLFEPKASTVVVNPGERIEYEAAVPTRDMLAGSVYIAEAALIGRPEVAADVQIKPR